MTGVLSACVGPVPFIIPELDSVSFASDNDNTAYAKVGNTVTLSFTSKEAIKNVTVTIGENYADEIFNTDGINLMKWKATRIMREGDTEGALTFTINFEDLEEINTYTQGATIGHTVIFDRTPPIITGRVTEDVTTAPDGTEWYFSNVTVYFEASDNLSRTTITPDAYVTITTEGENQSVTATATDRAGNTASVKVNGINIKKLIIVAVMDGAAYEQKIFDTCEDAMGHEDLEVDSSTSYARLRSNFQGDEIAKAMDKINALASDMEEEFGANRSDVRLLLVGKSLGGAKFYRMLFEYAEELAELKKVAVVFVDSHSDPPADEGRPGWNGPPLNDYVYFTGSGGSNSTFNLAWLSELDSNFNSASEQGDSDSKLRIYNIYSRRIYEDGLTYIWRKIKSILGYSFRDAYLNLHAVNWHGYSYDGYSYSNGKVFNLETGRQERVTHFNIDNCRETSNLIREAIIYIRH